MKIGDRKIQNDVINEMVRLCGFRHNGVSYCISAAARHVSGEDGETIGRLAENNPHVRISTSTVIRWYLHWLDFV